MLKQLNIYKVIHFPKIIVTNKNNGWPYTIIAITLYKQGKDDVLRRCVTSFEIPQILKEYHDTRVSAYRGPQYVPNMVHVRSQCCMLTIWYILKWSSPLEKH